MDSITILVNPAGRAIKIQKRILAALIVLVIGMILCSMIPEGGFFSIVLAFALAWYCIPIKNNTDVAGPFVCIVLLVLQNFCIGIGAHLTYNLVGISWITQVPFVFVSTLFLNGLLKKKRIESTDKVFIVYILFIFLAMLRSGASYEVKLIYFRNMTVFYFAYYVGKEYIDTDAKRLKYINMTVNVVVLVIIIGIVLRHCGTSIWNKIGIYEVYQAKKSVLESNGLPSRFYTRLINRAFLRMASLYYEPVNLAYLMAFGLIACLSEERIRYRNPKMMLSALGLILTFGKGGYLFTAFIILVQGIYTVIKKNLSEKKSYPLAVAISAFGCITVSVLYYRIGAGRTALYHYYGIIGTFRSILNNPLGYGLGMGGNMGVTFGQEIDWLSSGGETAIMSFAYQIGVPGVFALFILLFTLSKETMIINKKTYIKTISLGVILAGMFQENTFTPQCIIPLMMLQGIYSKKNYRKVMVNKIQNKS